jgi:hypothetical protein
MNASNTAEQRTYSFHFLHRPYRHTLVQRLKMFCSYFISNYFEVLLLIIVHSIKSSLRNFEGLQINHARTNRMHSETFFEYLAVCGIMWQNIVEPGRLQIKIWRMRIAFWIPNATNTHSKCVILISCQLQEWLHASVCILVYIYIAHFVYSAHRMHLFCVLLV